MSEIIILSSDGEENDETTSKKESPSTKLKPNQKQGTSLTSDPEVKNDAPFERFLDFCADIDMNKRNGRARTMNVIKEKLLARYNAADPEYIKSEAFLEIVSLAREKAENDPSNLFVYVKQVVDELKLRSIKKKNEACKRKIAKSEDEPESKCLKEETAVSEEEQNEVIKVNERHVAKLERLFQKVYRKVKKLGEKEVNFDENDDDSAYIKWTRYEKRLYLIWEKWQEAKGQLDEVKRLKSNRIAFAGTQYQNLNKAIEHFANKTQKFPDFHDILNLTTETLEGKEKNPEEIRKIAISAFTSLGDQLQKHRVYSFWNSLLTYLPSDMENMADPAEKDEELDKKLKENHKQNKHKMKEVLNNFVDQQNSLKLEPEEVPPGEEDDDCKSEGEGKEDTEEEEEQEEDIIAISSSSEESEVEENAEENGIGDADHCENGDARDTKELKLEVNKKTNSVKENSKLSSSGWFTVVKSDKNDKNMESIASCSSHRKKKVTEDSDCVVTLSESE